MNPAQLARAAFDAAVQAVRPEQLIDAAVRLREGEVFVDGRPLGLAPEGKLYVVGAGKAAGAMASALDRRLPDLVTDGLVIVKYGHAEACRKIRIVEAGHPYPDMPGLQATTSIVEMCRKAREKDVILCLLSGGGSALLADCPVGVELNSWIEFSKLLVNSGAAISEINAVRKHLSAVKGGQLARYAWPARMITLVLSDVVGDRLDVIASGPTVADPTTFRDALGVLEKYRLMESAPPPILRHLKQGADGMLEETPKPGDCCLSRSTNVIIGNNRMALAAAAEEVARLGAEVEIVTDSLQIDVCSAAQWIVETAHKRAEEHRSSKPFVLLFGGEPTLQVGETGKGGRCQHLALHAASLLRGDDRITLLAAGTDGTDGPTDGAGAWVDGQTWTRAIEAGADPAAYLQQFNSYEFFKAFGGQIITGPTRTNVMDVVIAVCSDRRHCHSHTPP